VPSSGENFTALDNTLITTCCSRSGSPKMKGMPRSICMAIRTRFSSAAGRTASRAAPMIASRCTGASRSSSFPDTMRDTSSNCSSSCACARALRSIASHAYAARDGSICSVRSIVAQPSTALMGVRSSCDTVARNSSLARLAACASR
jgi:hypothetical protein